MTSWTGQKCILVQSKGTMDGWMDGCCVATCLPSDKADGLSPASAPLLSATPTTNGCSRTDPTSHLPHRTDSPDHSHIYLYNIFFVRVPFDISWPSRRCLLVTA